MGSVGSRESGLGGHARCGAKVPSGFGKRGGSACRLTKRCNGPCGHHGPCEVESRSPARPAIERWSVIPVEAMLPEQYTDECSMLRDGPGPISCRPWTVSLLRLVCRPSFHPEVCVTLTPEEIVAVGLRSSLSSEPIPARMPELSERAPLSEGEFETICNAFASALDEAARPPEWVVICDGMAASAVRLRGGRSEQFSGHAVNDAESQFVVEVMSLALSKISSIPLRNRLSWCGRYATGKQDAAFPVVPEPALPEPQVSRLLVLGKPEDRADFHRLMGTKPAVRPPG